MVPPILKRSVILHAQITLKRLKLLKKKISFKVFICLLRWLTTRHDISTVLGILWTRKKNWRTFSYNFFYSWQKRNQITLQKKFIKIILQNRKKTLKRPGVKFFDIVLYFILFNWEIVTLVTEVQSLAWLLYARNLYNQYWRVSHASFRHVFCLSVLCLHDNSVYSRD